MNLELKEEFINLATTIENILELAEHEDDFSESDFEFFNEESQISRTQLDHLIEKLEEVLSDLNIIAS